MTELQAVAYASAIGQFIDAAGVASRAQALAALQAFGVAEPHANEILERGLTLGLYLRDPATGGFRARQQISREPTASLGDESIDPRKDPDVARRLALLRVLLSTLPVVMWAVDRAGYFVYYEGKGAKEMGLSDGEFVGRSFRDTFDSHESAKHVARAFEGEIVHSYWEFANRSWENWCFPIMNSSGEVELVALLSLNVTETRQIEEDLRRKLTTIERQQHVIRELSTPIIEIWDKVLALPLVGTVDSSRASEVMTSLLDAIVAKQARFVLLDLTGVEVVDTATAGHLIDLIAAVRLLGAEGVVTGLRSSVAQTMVSLGVRLEGMTTRTTLRQGLQECLRRLKIQMA